MAEYLNTNIPEIKINISESNLNAQDKWRHPELLFDNNLSSGYEGGNIVLSNIHNCDLVFESNISFKMQYFNASYSDGGGNSDSSNSYLENIDTNKKYYFNNNKSNSWIKLDQNIPPGKYKWASDPYTAPSEVIFGYADLVIVNINDIFYTINNNALETMSKLPDINNGMDIAWLMSSFQFTEGKTLIDYLLDITKSNTYKLIKIKQ